MSRWTEVQNKCPACGALCDFVYADADLILIDCKWCERYAA